MPNELPYLPFFVGDFLVTVSTWPVDRVGAYILALFYQFEHGGVPADDDAELARVLHVSRSQSRRLWAAIQQKGKFHQRADGLWWNQRLEEVRIEARAKVAKASDRGRNGASARWGKGALVQSASNAQAMHKQSLSNGIHIQSKDKERTPQPPADAGGRITRKELQSAERELRLFQASQPRYVPPVHQLAGVEYPVPRRCMHEPQCEDGRCLQRIAVDRRMSGGELMPQRKREIA